MDLALNNLRRLMSHLTKPNQILDASLITIKCLLKFSC